MAELGVTIAVDMDNPDLGDLRLDTTGHEVFVDDLSAEVAQRLTVRFNFEKGEWPLDLLEGTPLYEAILLKAPSDRIIRAVFEQVITGTQGVATLTGFNYSISPRRVMTAAFQCRLTNGVTFSSGDFGSFLIQLDDIRTQAASATPTASA